MSLMKLIRGESKNASRGPATATPATVATQGVKKAGTVARVATVAVATRPESKTDESVTSWGWRIIHQDGTEVEAYFSPVVTRDEALRLSLGAVNAEPVDDLNPTSTRVEIPTELVRLIRAMGQYWHYSDEDYTDAFEEASANPEQWMSLCLADQKIHGWTIPEGRTPNEVDRMVSEATEERRAILEYDAKLKAEQADAVTKLAANFYRHVFGVGYETKCCIARCGKYCEEGKRLRDAYHEVVS